MTSPQHGSGGYDSNSSDTDGDHEDTFSRKVREMKYKKYKQYKNGAAGRSMKGNKDDTRSLSIGYSGEGGMGTRRTGFSSLSRRTSDGENFGILQVGTVSS